MFTCGSCEGPVFGPSKFFGTLLAFSLRVWAASGGELYTACSVRRCACRNCLVDALSWWCLCLWFSTWLLSLSVLMTVWISLLSMTVAEMCSCWWFLMLMWVHDSGLALGLRWQWMLVDAGAGTVRCSITDSETLFWKMLSMSDSSLSIIDDIQLDNFRANVLCASLQELWGCSPPYGFKL